MRRSRAAIRSDAVRQRSTVQRVESGAQVRIGRAGSAAHWVALGKHRRDLAGEPREAETARTQHHVAEPRMHAQRGHLAPERRRAARGVDRLEPLQQVASLRERRRGRRIEPRQGSRIETSPARELECERREIGLEDLRRRLRQQRRVHRLAPQSVTDARLPCALRDRGAGRPTRARCAPSRAGSSRSPDRSAGVARARRRSRCARRRSSDSFRRCWSRSRPCGGHAGPVAAPHPGPRPSSRRTAATGCSAPRAIPSRAPRRRDGFRRRPAGTRARRLRARRVHAGSGSPPAAPRRASVRPWSPAQ